jgi:uncharacterized protein YacL (UPF0231 family)
MSTLRTLHSLYATNTNLFRLDQDLNHKYDDRLLAFCPLNDHLYTLAAARQGVCRRA